MNIIQLDAKHFVAMARTYAFYKRYRANWIKNIYLERFPSNPLSEQEFDSSGTAKPTAEFNQYVRNHHRRGLPNGTYTPSKRFKANADWHKKYS